MPNDSTPFVGPRPFKREDASLFFGRTDETDELLSLVVAEREILLYAQSGAGKTSLLNAGLTPLLEKEGFEVLPVARVRYEAREEVETQQTANVYVFNVVVGWSVLVHHVSNLDSVTLADFLDELPPQLDKEGLPRPRLLIFDQFEELFTFYPERANDRQSFFEQVRDALNKNRLLRVIFAMREEYIAELTPYAAILPEKLRTRFRLERLREPAALQAMTEPLTCSRFSFAPGVAEKVVQDLLLVNVGNKTHAVRGEYVEPVQLQVVCDALCRHLPPNVSVITQDHLQDFGNVKEALANFYKECLKETTRTTHVRRGRLRKWFERTLITPEGVRDTVRQGPTKTGDLPNRAVRKLEELHLIRGEERPGRGRWYELIHDTFIGPIQEVNRIADRRMRWLEGVVGSVGVVALVAICGFIIHGWNQAKNRELRYNGALAEGYHSLQDGRYQDAMKQFEQALEIHPEDRDAQLMAALSHSVLPGHDDQAVSHYHKALKIEPKASIYIAVSQIYLRKAEGAEAGAADVFFDKAEAEVNEAAKQYPASPEPDVARGDIEVGRERKREGGKHSDAEKYYREAIKKDSKSQDAYRGLAYVHLDRGEVDEAIGYARKAVELAPELDRPHGTLGQAYLWKENYYEAAAELGRAIGLNSKDYVSHNELGDIYYMKEKYEPARIEYEKALTLAGSLNDTIWMAAAASSLGYVALKQHKWDVAGDHFNKALDWDPKSSSAHFGRGLLLFTPKEPGKAKMEWNGALKVRDRTNPLGRMECVIYKVALGMPDSVENMSTIMSEHPPVGMMDYALDDVNLLVAFGIHLEESQEVRKMLVEAIEKDRKQPTQSR